MREKLKYLLCGSVILLFFVILVFGLEQADAATVLTFAGQNPIDHMSTKQMERVKELIEEASNGDIQIKLFPASQLGDYVLIYEELIKGTIDMALISIPSQFDPKLQINIVPYLVKDYAEARRLFAKDEWLFKKVAQLHANLDVKFLGFNAEGFGGLGIVKEPNEVLNPHVNKGVLIRVPPMDVAKYTIEGMGYQTVSIPYAELYTALQTGVADGWYGGTPAHNYLSFRDVIKHYYQLNIYVENEHFLVSQKTWSNLTNSQQKIIEEAVNEVANQSFDISEAEDEMYMDKMKKYEIKVYTYSAEELEPLAKNARENIWPRLENILGEKLIEEISTKF